MIVTMTQLHSWSIIAIVMPGGALMSLQSESQLSFHTMIEENISGSGAPCIGSPYGSSPTPAKLILYL